MKREFRSFWMVSILFVGLLLATACSSTANAPTTAVNQASVGRTQLAAPAGAQETPTPAAQQNRQNRTPQSATATVTAPAAVTSTPAAKNADPTTLAVATSLFNNPTPTIAAAGKISLPDQKQAIHFAANAATTVITETHLINGVFKAYQFDGSAGQVLHLAVNGNLKLQVLDPDQIPVSPIVVMPGFLNVTITKTGSYTLGLDGLGEATIAVFLSPASTPALNAPVPAQSQAVEIPSAPLSVSFPSKGEPSSPAGYTFEAKAGQSLILTLTGNVVPFVVGPDGNALVPDTDAITHQWKFFLAEPGKTSLVLLGSGPISVTTKIEPYSGTVTLPAAPVKGATPILINARNSMIQLNTVFQEKQPQSYVAHLQANQILIITASGAAGVTAVSGPGGNAVELTHSQYSTEWSAAIAQEGDYTMTLAGAGPSLIQFSIP